MPTCVRTCGHVEHKTAISPASLALAAKTWLSPALSTGVQ